MSEHCNLLYNQFSAVFQRLSWNSEHKVNSFNQSANVASVKKAGKKVTDSGQKHNMRVLHAKLENSSAEPVRKRIVIPRNVLKRPLVNLIFLEIVIFYAQLVNKSHRKLRFVRRICIAHLRCVIDRVYRLITWFNHCFFTFSRKSLAHFRFKLLQTWSQPKPEVTLNFYFWALWKSVLKKRGPAGDKKCCKR